MNYITEIKAFHDLVQLKQLSTGQIALWYSLMYINNKCAWIEWFTVSNQMLELCSGLSRQGVLKARNCLKQYGLIDFISNGTKATSYTILSIAESVQVRCQVGVQDSIQVGVQDSSTLNKRNKTKPNHLSPPNTQNDIQNHFESFWQAYPRKVSKANALKAFQKLGPDEALLSDMLKSLDIQKQSDQWVQNGGQYIPHPATWISGRRWEDETSVVEDEPIPENILTLESISALEADTSRSMEELESLSLEDLL